MRILALHGYHGSAEQLRRQLDWLDVFAFDAPSRADGDFGWWHARDGRYVGWERTRDAIGELLAKHSFDGVLGFSQGAVLTSLLVGLFEFRFAIMIGGFPSRDPAHAEIYARTERYARPSLHIIGRADTVVPPDASRMLAARFHEPTILEHAGGHVIPTSDDVRAAIATIV
ncbi:MAG: hypothetical protein QM831_03155 [Kofleriaceae bacterium]